MEAKGVEKQLQIHDRKKAVERWSENKPKQTRKREKS